MEARDWFGLALAALIGLLTLAIEPWSGLWWASIILAAVVAVGSLIGIGLRHYGIAADRNIFVPLCAVLALLFAASVAMRGFWPLWKDDSKFANFHIVATDVAWNRQNLNQLIANITFQNDAGDADLSTYSATGFSPNPEDKATIDLMRKNVAKIEHENKALHFNVKPKETKWFTIPGAVLPDDLKEKYTKGELTFYFVSTMIINEHGAVKPMEFCGFVTGNNPNAILECPSPSPS
jgi:hypothetical protein